MKYLYKICSFILVLSILITALPVCYAVETEAEYDTKYINRMKAFGLLAEEEDFDEFVTRGEMAKLIAQMLDITSLNSDKLYFTDVSHSHEYYSYITVATEQGYISGYSDGTFRTDEFVTYEQAIKLLVTALGYGYQAKVKGDYPTGYMAIAYKLNLLKGIDADGTSYIKRYNLARLASNTLEAPYLEQTVFGGEEGYGDDRTLMQVRLGIEEIKDRVVAVGDYSYKAGLGVARGEVRIGNCVYKNAYSEIASYVGQNVVGYYRKDDTSGDDMLIYAENNEHNAICIDAVNLEGYANNTLEYYHDKNDTKKQRANISNKAYVVFNGLPCENYSDADFDVDTGSITLISTGGGNNYDIVIIESYETLVVSGINTQSNVIYDKFSSLNSYELPQKEENVVIMGDDGEIELSDIYLDYVLQICASKNNEKVLMKVINENFYGKIEAVYDEGVVINGQEYELSEYFKSTGQTASLNKKGDFYLDSSNRIVMFGKDYLEEAGYGYVLNAAVTRNFGKKVQVKMLDDTGKVEVFDVAEKVTLDGDRIKATETNGQGKYKFLEALSYEPGSTPEKRDFIVRQPIRYRLNENGELSYVDTFIRGAEEEDDSLRNDTYCQTLSFRPSASCFFTHSSGQNPGKSNVGVNAGSTIIIKAFAYDNDTQKRDSVEDKHYKRLVMTDISEGTNNKIISAYNITDGGYAELIVLYTDNTLNTRVTETSPYAMVDKITYRINSDGEEQKVITAYNLGVQKNFVLAEPGVGDITVDGVTRSVQKGDVIRYLTNGDGEITSINLVYDIVKREKSMTAGTLAGGYFIACGLAYSKDTYGMKLAMYNDVAGEYVLDDTYQSGFQSVIYQVSPFVHIFDEREIGSGEVYTGTVDDIVTYKNGGEGADIVLGRFASGKLNDVYVFRFK